MVVDLIGTGSRGSSICFCTIKVAATMRTGRPGQRRSFDVEDPQSERQADSGSERRCTRRHPEYPIGCGTVSVERLGPGEIRPISEASG
jgi:hypothetical protein